jgi:hypothetical protein
MVGPESAPTVGRIHPWKWSPDGDAARAIYCWAAIYRLTKDPKHIASLERTVKPDDGFTSFVVGHYLLEKAGTNEAAQ